jgi:hypothetical protein
MMMQRLSWWVRNHFTINAGYMSGAVSAGFDCTHYMIDILLVKWHVMIQYVPAGKEGKTT